MASNNLTPIVDAWTVQGVAASRWLTRLYRSLGDDRQAAIAIQAGDPVEQRLGRLRLQRQLAIREELSSQAHQGETQAEEAAWIALIEALAGLCAFYALSDTGSQEKTSPGLRGARSAANGAFIKTLRGFRTAFPESQVNEGISLATKKASTTCAGAILSDIKERDDDLREQIRSDLEMRILDALKKVVAVET